MNMPRPNLYRTTLALGCAFALAFTAATVTKATTTPQPLSAKAAAVLPLTATFEKVAGEVPPYVLKLKNDSAHAIKASAKVLLSVVNHSADKARHEPAHVIEPGQVWTIKELAANDKVIITADGFAALELTVK